MGWLRALFVAEADNAFVVPLGGALSKGFRRFKTWTQGLVIFETS